MNLTKSSKNFYITDVSEIEDKLRSSGETTRDPMDVVRAFMKNHPLMTPFRMSRSPAVVVTRKIFGNQRYRLAVAETGFETAGKSQPEETTDEGEFKVPTEEEEKARMAAFKAAFEKVNGPEEVSKKRSAELDQRYDASLQRLRELVESLPDPR